jgi:hypothetical protein
MSKKMQETGGAMVSALKYILDRLVDFAISFGITYPTFEGLLKRSYLERASKGFKLEGKEQTDSRISLLTGLNRRDIRALRTALHDEKPLAVSLETRVARAWTTPPFIGKDGMRAPLPRLASVGGVRSFESLVQHVSTDIRAAVLLDDWVQKGFATIDEQDQVIFHKDVYFGVDSKLSDSSNHLAHTAGDLISGFAGIMRNDTPRPLRIHSVNVDYLSQESLDKLFNIAYDMMIKEMGDINKMGEEASMLDRKLPTSTGRFTYCTYVYRADLYKDPPALRAELGLEPVAAEEIPH